MKKTIKVCGYNIEVASNAASMIRYKMAFHRDAMRDLMTLAKGLPDKKKAGNEQLLNAVVENETFDFDIFYRFLWIFAKAANDDTPDFLPWLESFDVSAMDFVVEAFPQVQELLTANMHTIVKSKKN